MVNENVVPAIKEFKPGETRRYEQAHIIWLILTGWIAANKRNKKTITYGELAEMMGYGRRAGRSLAGALGLVSLYCVYNGLPPMSVIVVNQDTHEPGWQDMVQDSLKKDQERVFSTDWYCYRVPSVGTFRKANDHLDWKEFIKQ